MTKGSRRVPCAGSDRGLKGFSLLVFIFLFAPIVTVFVYSFNAGQFLTNWTGFGTKWFGVALSNANLISALKVSVVVAVGAACCGVVIGGLGGIALARLPKGARGPLQFLLFVILAVPEIVAAVGYLLWFVRLRFASGVGRMILGQSVFGSALVAFIVYARLRSMDDALEEAAADLGAKRIEVFRTVTLPWMGPALTLGGILAFTFSLDDVIISEFVSTAGSTPLPVFIFASLKTGLQGDIAAIAVIMFGVTVLVFAIGAWRLSRAGYSKEKAVLAMAGQGE